MRNFLETTIVALIPLLAFGALFWSMRSHVVGLTLDTCHSMCDSTFATCYQDDGEACVTSYKACTKACQSWADQFGVRL